MDPDKTVKDEADKLRILSIDGGGVRGVIPATILKYLEEELQRIDNRPKGRLADYFDLIVGTSTGGLITAMITTPHLKKDDPQELPFSAEQVLEFYLEVAAYIFPPARLPGEEFLKNCKHLFRPKYNPKKLDALLETYCGNRTLSEALTNVIIPCFDIERQSPVFFSSWEPRLKAALVKDVCRGTTAGPTYFPPVYFTVPPTEDKKKKDHTKKDPQTQAVGEILEFNVIDGGIAVNNPTYVGITLAMNHFSRRNPVNGMAYQNFSNFLALSLGTGEHRTRYSAKDAAKWGVINWLQQNRDIPLVSCLFNASADMVDYNLSMTFKAHNLTDNYLRIQPDIVRELSKLDDSKNLKKVMEIAVEVLTEQNVFQTSESWEIVPTRTGEKIKEKLHRFAMRLSKLRKMRRPKIF